MPQCLRGSASGGQCLRGRAKLSRCIFKVLIPNIAVLSAYIALFRPKMSDIGILHFFKLKRFSRFKDISTQCHYYIAVFCPKKANIALF